MKTAMEMNAKEKTKQHFNETAVNYNSSSNGKFVKPMYEVILKEIQASESGKILDVGCGNGTLFTFLPDEKYELFGVDFSENMIAEAKKAEKQGHLFSLRMQKIFRLTGNSLISLFATPLFITIFTRTLFWRKCIEF